MKNKIMLTIGVMLAVLLCVAVTGYAQQDMSDVKGLCEEAYLNASQTRDIVANGMKTVEAEITEDSSDLKIGEFKDGKEWFEKADALLNENKAKMDNGEYTKDIAIDLGLAWQWFIKSGSAITRAGMQE
ncbi:MAG TPA: hypothetical protein ENN35_00885 [Deltaproteobacteria bacterium]|nr:hypothetical protein [Deltaproteobacteria bacterium]